MQMVRSPMSAVDGGALGYVCYFAELIDEWADRLREAGADVVVWAAGNRVGEGGERTARQLDEFADAVDIALVGLGN